MEENLTQQDKANLLGIIDGKGMNDSYDQEFYEAMCQVRPLDVDEVDDRVRRAILRFIDQGKGEASKPENGGFVAMGFVHGYMVGQKLKRDITRKP